jgi:hypothetical protein
LHRVFPSIAATATQPQPIVDSTSTRLFVKRLTPIDPSQA